MHLSYDRQPLPPGREVLVGWGNHDPAARDMDPAMLARNSQPNRLRVAERSLEAVSPTSCFEYRLCDPRSRHQSRVVDPIAPMISRPQELAPFAYRRTEAPARFQQDQALGGRRVLIMPPGR